PIGSSVFPSCPRAEARARAAARPANHTESALGVLRGAPRPPILGEPQNERRGRTEYQTAPGRRLLQPAGAAAAAGSRRRGARHVQGATRNATAPGRRRWQPSSLLVGTGNDRR